MKRSKKTKIQPAALEGLSGPEMELLDEVKASLWSKLDELMTTTGYESEEDFNFKMGVWVQYEASIRTRSEREIVLLAAQLIQRRFYTVMSIAMKADDVIELPEYDDGKVVEFKQPSKEDS